MSQLIVMGFRDRFRGAEILNDLRRRELDWAPDLDHAVVLTLDNNGRARVQLSVDLSIGEPTAWAALWGSFLRVTLFMPATEVIARAAGILPSPMCKNNGLRAVVAPDSNWWRKDLNLGEFFLRDIGALVKNDGSAIFMLLHNHDRFQVCKELQNYGSMIIHTTLTAEQDRKISEFFF